jgi:preprotein translocase subunit SecG
MVTFLTVVHITVCLFLILVVLLQAGKGGGMGIAFGGGGSQTVFGSSGAGNFLTRLTSVTAAVFLVTSLALAHYSSRQDSKRLQDLASERATQKKTEEEKAAKLKADLDKTRPATTAKDGGAGAGSTEAPATAPAAPVTLPLPVTPTPSGATLPLKMELTKPQLGAPGLKPSVTAKPAGPAKAEGPAPKAGVPVAAPAAAPKRPARVKPAVVAKPPGDEPAGAPAPSEPAPPAAPAAE